MVSALFWTMLGVSGALVFFPAVGGFFAWWTSFRVPVYLYKEIGKDENDSMVRRYWAKVKNNRFLGYLVAFRPFQARHLREAKRYNNTLWSRVRLGKRSREGILLYAQGSNYRPMKAIEYEDEVVLRVLNEDNREFIIDREMARGMMGEAARSVLWTIVTFSGALVLITLFALLSFVYLGGSDIAQYTQAVQAGPVIGGIA